MVMVEVGTACPQKAAVFRACMMVFFGCGNMYPNVLLVDQWNDIKSKQIIKEI